MELNRYSSSLDAGDRDWLGEFLLKSKHVSELTTQKIAYITVAVMAVRVWSSCVWYLYTLYHGCTGWMLLTSARAARIDRSLSSCTQESTINAPHVPPPRAPNLGGFHPHRIRKSTAGKHGVRAWNGVDVEVATMRMTSLFTSHESRDTHTHTTWLAHFVEYSASIARTSPKQGVPHFPSNIFPHLVVSP